MFAVRFKFIFPIVDTSTNMKTNQVIGVVALVLITFFAVKLEKRTTWKFGERMLGGFAITVGIAVIFASVASYLTGAADTAGILEHLGFHNVRAIVA